MKWPTVEWPWTSNSWHFACAGLLAGVIAAILTGGFIWYQAALAMLVMGPLVGAVVWLISEWRQPAT